MSDLVIELMYQPLKTATIRSSNIKGHIAVVQELLESYWLQRLFIQGYFILVEKCNGVRYVQIMCVDRYLETTIPAKEKAREEVVLKLEKQRNLLAIISTPTTIHPIMSSRIVQSTPI